MSLLAEVVVEEWLNRNGYFTIRGIRIGNDEVDLLAIKIGLNGVVERRHVEVQTSSRPVGYLVRKNARKLSEAELAEATQDWVQKKFDNPKKQILFRELAPGDWSKELVYHRLREEASQCRALEGLAVKLTKFESILRELKRNGPLIPKAGGSDLLELISLLDEDDLGDSDDNQSD